MTPSRKVLCAVYLAFSISGAIFPMMANIEFMQSYDQTFDIYKFIELANINPAAQSLSRDLLIGSGAIIIWIISEAKRLNIKYLWVILLTTVTISFAFAAPLFLFLRERRLIELEMS